MTNRQSMGDLTHNQPSQSQPEVRSVPSSQNSQLQGRLFHIFQLVSRHLVPSTTGVAIAQELREIFQVYNDQLIVLRREHTNLGHRLQDKQRLLENIVEERDRAYQERDTIQAQYNEFLRQNRSNEGGDIKEALHEEIDKLRSEILPKDEQLQRRQSVWVEKQKSSSSKRLEEAESRDPFTTPINKVQAGSLSVGANKSNPSRNLTGNFKALQAVPDTLRPKEMKNSSAPPITLRYPSSLSAGYTFPNQEPGRESMTNFTGIPADQNSQALVPFKTMDQLATEFSEMISKLYGLIEGWSHTYGGSVNPLEADQRVSRDEERWKLMVECVSADKQDFADAEHHLVFLLREPSTRAWLIFRVIVQYIERGIWTGLAFLGFDEDCDGKLGYAVARLKERGLNLSERASLISTRTSVISHIVDSERYLAFRDAALLDYTKKLRALLGPLLNVAASRADAARDLSAIVVNAFDISTKIFTSNCSFVIIFPKCGDKFQYTSMICRDSNHCIDSLTLQIKQYRLKLVITPIITLRDDRQLTIKVASVQYANVLVMV